MSVLPLPMPVAVSVVVLVPVPVPVPMLVFVVVRFVNNCPVVGSTEPGGKIRICSPTKITLGGSSPHPLSS
ncbi:MAG: hypothetical protein CUN55_11490 [Phototrophicales bacterium]|nr:MAG: hypothetical protein CUN55_11490 [Phototrophicales bacterium]